MTTTASNWHPPLIFEITDHEDITASRAAVISSRHPKRATPFKRGEKGQRSRRAACTKHATGGSEKKQGGGVFAERPLVKQTEMCKKLVATRFFNDYLSSQSSSVGGQRIGAGLFEHRIEMSTGDELEQLADRFNEMATELSVSQEKSERISRLKRFLAPQVAEIVEGSSHRGLLDGQRKEVLQFSEICGGSRPSLHRPSPTLS